MEQRRPRLGDILDDYCPRERRVTNHVIVAIVEDEVKHTRCSTCDADHEYKQARMPPLRKKREAGALANDVSSEVRRPRKPDAIEPLESDDAVGVELEADLPVDTLVEMPVAVVVASATLPVDVSVVADEPVVEREDDGPVHRRLIRATLPRPEGQVPERKETEFTVRAPGGRGEMDGNRGPNGQRRHRRRQRGPGEHGGDVRFGGSSNEQAFRGGGNGNRPPRPQGHTSGQGGGEGRHRRRGR